MKYLDFVLGTRVEKYDISTNLSKRAIKNTIERLERAPLFKARNRLTGFIDGDFFSLKLDMLNLYPFLPIVTGDVSQLDQGSKIKIKLSYYGLSLSLLKFWFFITHAIVVFLAAIFFVNFISGKTQLPLTVNGQTGYFFNNIWLLLISAAIAITFIWLPILIEKYCWEKSKSETLVLFGGDSSLEKEK